MSYIGPPPGFRKYQAGLIGAPPGASSRSVSSSWYAPKAPPHSAHESCAADLVMEADRRGDGDRVQVRLGEHLADARERVRDAVALRGRLGSLEHGIAQRLNPDPVLEVVLGQVRQDAA